MNKLEWRPVTDGRYRDGIRPNCLSSFPTRWGIAPASFGKGYWVTDQISFQFLRDTFDTPETAVAAVEAQRRREIRETLAPLLDACARALADDATPDDRRAARALLEDLQS